MPPRSFLQYSFRLVIIMVRLFASCAKKGGERGRDKHEKGGQGMCTCDGADEKKTSLSLLLSLFRSFIDQ